MNIRMIGLYGIFAAFCVASAVWPVGAEAVELKVGFVDEGRVFDAYKEKDLMEQELRKEGDVKKGALERAERDLQNRKDAFALLSKEAKEDERVELQTRIVEVNDLRRKTLVELDRKRTSMIEALLKDLSGFIKKYAKDNSYDFILNDKVLLFGRSELDVTDDIIDIVNK